MKKLFTLSVVLFAALTGCARDNLSPFSPRAQQRIENQGKINDIKSAQDSIMKEVGQLRTEVAGNQNKIQSTTGTNNRANTGVQILSGDSALVVIFCLGALGILGVVYYRTKSVKAEKTANIFAQQIAMHNNSTLNDNVFLAAMNSPVEAEVYHTMVKSQTLRKFN